MFNDFINYSIIKTQIFFFLELIKFWLNYFNIKINTKQVCHISK